MMNLTVNLCIMQPTGYLHALGLLDPALYFRHQLEQQGVKVYISKNRLRHESVNLILGAHLGFRTEWMQGYRCVFINLEQLGGANAEKFKSYLGFLKTQFVLDYAARNAELLNEPDLVGLADFGYAPYLQAQDPVATEDRPIDLLFFGSLNAARKKKIEALEAHGLSVTLFDKPLYAEERNQYIRMSKAVVNFHYYENHLFEQVRAFQCLSMGAAFVSERHPSTEVPAAYEDCVFWLRDEDCVATFAKLFKSSAFAPQARSHLERFQQQPISEFWSTLPAQLNALAFSPASRAPKIVKHINIGSGKDYKLGWLNIDILARALPDVVLDLGGALQLPISGVSDYYGPYQIDGQSIEHVFASNVLEHVPDLPAFMTNILNLLQDGGIFEIEVPYYTALEAWQDPTHVRAMNESSWLYYTDWFWYLGWLNHRFEQLDFEYLNSKLETSTRENASFMRVKLIKRPTTDHEKNLCRSFSADFLLD